MFGRWSRRDLLKTSGAVAPVALSSAPAAAQVPVHAVNERDNLYARIGVRPILNARGTYTIISGSRSLPEVKQAMFEASHYHVHLDELMDGSNGSGLMPATLSRGASPSSTASKAESQSPSATASLSTGASPSPSPSQAPSSMPSAPVTPSASPSPPPPSSRRSPATA